MFGAIIIDPPELEPVDQEFVMIQSELYLGAEGQPGDLGKMIDEDFDAVVFNGYHNQYKHAPIRVDADKVYRVWVIDDGPSENSAFHIVGTIFDTVFKEGSYLLQPDETSGGSQVLDLQPAQGGFVEFSFAEDGSRMPARERSGSSPSVTSTPVPSDRTDLRPALPDLPECTVMTRSPDERVDDGALSRAQALADPSRARIHRLLTSADQPLTIAALARLTGLHRTAVGTHLGRLVRAGLAEREVSAPVGRGRPVAMFRAVAPD
eukprot:gene27914-49654_t